jgi:hypothetical protein
MIALWGWRETKREKERLGLVYSPFDLLYLSVIVVTTVNSVPGKQWPLNQCVLMNERE